MNAILSSSFLLQAWRLGLLVNMYGPDIMVYLSEVVTVCNLSIVVVGYNRLDAVKNLTRSLLAAKYERGIDLWFSFDRSDLQNELVRYANSVEWPNGNKYVRAFDERQGLRQHILSCGDLTERYDAVVVLEDDLEVSPYFLGYVLQALDAYGNDSRVAGISLYKHCFHPGVNRPFEPEDNGADVYAMQFAMSWGQCWTREMWQGFRAWYSENSSKDLAAGDLLPRYVARWNEKSWLKYYMRYIVETDKYFVYPNTSLTTNSSKAGEHRDSSCDDYMVPLLRGTKKYSMPALDLLVRYDVFFERQTIKSSYLDEYEGKVLLDLYGERRSLEDCDFLVSTAVRPLKIVDEFSMRCRPIEANCYHPTPGKEIRVYDVHCAAKAVPIKRKTVQQTRYDVKGVHWKGLLHLGLSGLYGAIKTRLDGIKRG